MSFDNLPGQIIKNLSNLDPAASEKVLGIIEREQTHRHRMEERIRDSELRDMRRGQIFAFTIALFFGLMGGFLIYLDHDLAGSAFGSSGILGIVTAFIAGRKRSGDSSSEKKK